MKKWHSLIPNWAIIVIITLIVTLYMSFSYLGFSLLTKATTLIIIPILLVIYFYRQPAMANIFFTIFVLYFLGIIFSVLDNESLSPKLSESCFLGVYALLTLVMIGKLRHVKFQGLVSVYLIMILLVNTYFMYVMYATVKDSFSDNVILALSVSKGIALLLMGFLAFAIYLGRETSQSIIFLTIVCCFVFSDVLNFITTMYIHFWLFEGAQKILQGAGLLLFCIYVYNHQELVSSFRNVSAQPISQPQHLSV